MKLDGRKITAVVPTRGDVDVEPTVAPLREFCDEMYVWNNRDNVERTDYAVYGRYAAAVYARHDVIVTVDDDVIPTLELLQGLVDRYEPGYVTCNMPARFRQPFYDRHALVGFGAIFDRHLPSIAFAVLAMHLGLTDLLELTDPPFVRTCDIVFTALTSRITVDLPYADREYASGPDRMWTQAGHVAERTKMLELALTATDLSTRSPA